MTEKTISDLRFSRTTHKITTGKQKGTLSIVIDPSIALRLGLSIDDSLTQQLVDGGILLKVVPRAILGVE